MKSSRIYILLGFIILIIAGAFLFFNNDGKNLVEESQQILSRSEESSLSLNNLQSGKKEAYRHENPVFSFNIPEGFKVGSFPQGVDEGETILVQKGNVGFQLDIIPFEENVALTEERIKQDVPDIVIEEPIQIKIDGASGLTFLSVNEASEKTREVWWVYRGFLYQVTTYPEFDEPMVVILESWKF